MPKRIVDGDSLWRSHKLRQVQPEKYRAEFANLIPLALANGVFEADPDLVWSTVYSFNRPEVTRTDVAKILAEFERVGLLLRWMDVNGIHYALNGNQPEAGKIWGYWIGIEKPGRLPGESRRGKNERVGPTPPKSMDSLERLTDSSEHPTGTDSRLGFGSGIGSGSGLGEGKKSPLPQPDWVDERDSRELAKAKRAVLARISAAVGAGNSVNEDEFMTAVCEESGLLPGRVRELEQKSKWVGASA